MVLAAMGMTEYEYRDVEETWMMEDGRKGRINKLSEKRGSRSWVAYVLK